MPLFTYQGQNLDGVVFTAAIIVIPALYPHLKGIITTLRSDPSSNAGPVQKTSTLRILEAFVWLHSLYILYVLTLSHPSNIFSSLNVPLITPSPSIRLLYAMSRGEDAIDPPLESLLSRLQSLDVREAYVRFGHDAVTYCDFCRSKSDFQIFGVPTLALQYLRTIAVIGYQTIRGSGKRDCRGYFVTALVLAALAECYVLSSVDVQISANQKSNFMWHDRLWQIRQLLFLALPLILHSLPYSRHPYANLSTIPQAVQNLDKTIASLQLLDATRKASLRDEDLRAAAAEYWAQDAHLSNLARHHEGIREEASRAGLGFAGESGGAGGTDGPVLQAAKVVVQQWKEILTGILSQSGSLDAVPLGSS